MLAMLLMTVATMTSCEDVNFMHDKYLKDGEAFHVGKIDSLRIFSGEERVLLRVWVTDMRTKYLEVFKPNSEGSVWYDVTRISASDSVDIYVDGLMEGSNVLDMYTWNESKTVQSIPMNHTVYTFGALYQSTLLNRTLTFRFLSGRMNILWGPMVKNQIGQEVKYTKSTGVDTVMFVAPNATTTALTDYVAGNSFQTRTLFLPTPTCIDTFRTAYEEFQ